MPEKESHAAAFVRRGSSGPQGAHRGRRECTTNAGIDVSARFQSGFLGCAKLLSEAHGIISRCDIALNMISADALWSVIHRGGFSKGAGPQDPE